MGPIYLGHISKHLETFQSKDWSVDNTKKTGFTGYVYDFNVDYKAIAVEDIKNIHKDLMEKNSIVWIHQA